MASSNGEDSIVAPSSDGRLAPGVCHWKASRLPVISVTVIDVPAFLAGVF
jgi:hypothetical protein